MHTACALRADGDDSTSIVLGAARLGESRPSLFERGPRIRVLLANRQPIARHGMRAVLASEPDIHVIAEAESGLDAVKLARELRPDVVVIDLVMADVDGITATRMIRTDVSCTKVLVMVGANDDMAAVEAIRVGASACLPSHTQIELVLEAIRSANSGQVMLPSRAVLRLIRRERRVDSLTERELEVLQLIAQGSANKQIARQLDLAPSTVKSHLARIFTKLGVASRTQAVLYAAQSGLV
jgi:DNA-binding NarL/FixJ family response regulator